MTPRRYNAFDVETWLRANERWAPFPPSSDRVAWRAAREALPPTLVDELVADAEQAARRPLPALPATLFLEFDRTGERDGYQEPQGERRAILSALVVGECLEDRGRFLDPILDAAWATCEESSWQFPAHQRVLTDVERPGVDLGAAMTALELAECAHLVGERLDPAVAKRIRDEVSRRCVAPFLTRHDFWWMHATEQRSVNNWTAVCVGGVVGAAAYLEPDAGRLAEAIARALPSLDDYLTTFDEDGGSSEGPGYWSFGFGYYVVLAHLLEARTGGRLRLLDAPRLRDVARYPVRTLLSPGQYANFSDCDRDVSLQAPLLARLGLDGLANAQGPSRPERWLTWRLRGLFWRPDPAARVELAERDFFRGMHWLIARADPGDGDGLVLAAKGGHNAEMHNQNDVGSFIVHWRGKSLIAELGRGRYTRAYFGPERYDHLVNSSLGHSVPVVNGLGQLPGPERRAELIGQDGDSLALELSAAYPPEADLASLRRTVALHRDGAHGWVSLDDEATFRTGPGRLECPLMTFGQALVEDGAVAIDGRLRVSFDPALLEARVDELEAVDLAEGPTDVRRIVFTPRQAAVEASVRLRIEPVAEAAGLP
jgi:hypothetical protein